MTVNTKTAERRDVSFRTLEDLVADLDRVEAAHRAGTLTHTGNWTPGQVIQHCAIFMRCAMDGFPPGKPPAPIRSCSLSLPTGKATITGKGCFTAKT